MAGALEQQVIQEELEVLNSIFEGDEAFRQISNCELQYKVGEDGASKSFLLSIKWPADYPTCKPEIDLDAFYNKHLRTSVKQKILDEADEQAEAMIGEAVTYTLIDWAKESLDTLMEDQPEFIAKEEAVLVEAKESPVRKKKEKKEQLTKAQKRKLADRTNASGERPRGWDWVDVVKHLSQTGRAATS